MRISDWSSDVCSSDLAKSFREAIRQALFGGWLFFKFYGVPALLNFVLGGTKRARSIERLAEKCGIDAGGLRQTIDDLNAGVESGSADAHKKSADHYKDRKSVV